MEIRYLNKNDDPLALSDVYEKSWRFAYKGIVPQKYLDSIQRGRWANTADKDGLCSLVMTDNGMIVGTLSFCGSRWEKYRGYGEIVSLYLLPEYMGKGYGRLLLERGIEELKKLGHEKVLLWTLEENTRARRFYERNGFECAQEYMDDELGGKPLREVLYYISVSRGEK